MKTRLFQHIVFLSMICTLFYGCQSAPFANQTQSSEGLAQNTPDTENESAMQRNLREAMAAEREKIRLAKLQQNSQSAAPESLAALSGQTQTQKLPATNFESNAMPSRTSQQSKQQPNLKSVTHELNLAYDADRSGNSEKAQGYYQRVLSIDPENFEALHRLAILEDKKKNYPAAEAYYLRALKIDSTNADLLSDIGYSYMLQGRDDYGEKYLQEALKYQPGHIRSLDHMGWFYGRSGHYEQAMSMFRMTSDEAQAQLKFAQLFPDVALNKTALAQATTAQHHVQMVSPENRVPQIQPVGQIQAGQNQPVQYAADAGSRESTSPMQAPAGSNPTQQIVEMMKREREKALEARGQVQQLPSIIPNQAMTRQPVAFPNPPGTNPSDRRLMDQSLAPTVTTTGTPQIEAWPPVGDPGVNQAVEASNYWALKEQEHQQQQQQGLRQAAPMTFQQQQNTQNRQPNAQGQNHRFPGGASHPQNRRQSIPQQQRSANVPQTGQRMYGNQYQQPRQFPDYRINSIQPRAQQSAPYSDRDYKINDQQQLREAARTGMNLGPGQMFPVASDSQNKSNGSGLMSAQFPSNSGLPASAQVSQQNVYQAGGQNIQQAQVGQPMNQPQSANGIRQVGYEFPNQQSYQLNGRQVSSQNWNSGGNQQGTSGLPPSALYSTNQAVAPANVRVVQSNMNQNVPQNAQLNGLNRMGNQRQNVMNQNSNGLGSSPVQWGSQPTASPYRFPSQQNR